MPIKNVMTTSWNYRTVSVRPPGPKGYVFVGNLRAFRQRRLSFLLDLPRYGDLTFMRLGHEPVYALHHPDLIRAILIEQPGKFQKLRLTRRLFNRTLRGTPDARLSQTEAWKQRRELVQEALHTKRIPEYVQAMVEEARAMLSSVSWQSGCSIDIYQQMRALTLRVASRVLFGSALTTAQVAEI